MTRAITRKLLIANVVDAYAKRVYLGDRAVDLSTGNVCIILDHCPELGPESLYVQLVEHDGPSFSYWVAPKQLVKLPREAA